MMWDVKHMSPRVLRQGGVSGIGGRMQMSRGTGRDTRKHQLKRYQIKYNDIKNELQMN